MKSHISKSRRQSERTLAKERKLIVKNRHCCLVIVRTNKCLDNCFIYYLYVFTTCCNVPFASLNHTLILSPYTHCPAMTVIGNYRLPKSDISVLSTEYKCNTIQNWLELSKYY